MIAEEVRATRRQQGLRQADVATRAGLSQSAVADLERGLGTMQVLGAVMRVIDMRLTGLPREQTLGARVRAARARKGWSLDRTATAAGISKGAVLRVEAGTARVVSFEAVVAALVPSATVRSRKPDRSNWAGGGRDQRFTPEPFLDTLIAVLGPIDLDPAGHRDSPVRAASVFYQENDGLSQPWSGDLVFVNPPYSQQAVWIPKAFAEWTSGRCRRVIMLLPVRTSSRAFHDIIAVHADTLFLRDRLKFGGMTYTAAFPNLLAAFGLEREEVAAMRQEFSSVYLAPSGGTVPPRINPGASG